ncbi:MAG: hypothetical protein WCS37_19445 [Chloroflexota bacterium]|nr:hypothetical protein [Chloroflexota bacterium]
MSNRAIFELSLSTLPEFSNPSVLGLWTEVAGTDAGLEPREVSFDLSNPESTILSEIPCWRVRLPENLSAAEIGLNEGSQVLQLSRKAVPEASSRLAKFMQSGGRLQVGEPELELARLVGDPSILSGEQSFGLGDLLKPRWEQVTQQFQGVVSQVCDLISGQSLIETRMGESRIGYSLLTRSGRLSTIWQSSLELAQVELHRRNLALTLQSRETLFWTFGVAVRGAIPLAQFFMMPGGPLLALPAACRFIWQVQSEYRERHKSNTFTI